MDGPVEPHSRPSPSRLGKFKTAAISCDGDLCSDVGRDVMTEGGSAVDAAIAALFVNGLVNPQSAGLGGGLLMTVYDPTSKTAKCLDARETAPLAAHRDMFVGDATLARKGGLAVAVPSELAGLWAAHQAYGRLAWSRLIQPAVELADSGVIVQRHLAETLARDADWIKADPSMRVFVDEKTGDVLRLGDTLRMPMLAKTLREIALRGADAIYSTGDCLGDLLVRDVQRRGGILTKEDLIQYRVRWVEPVRVDLENDLTMFSVPPPGSGVLTGYILKMLDGHLTEDSQMVAQHRVAEAFKHAFGQRTKLGDPNFVPEVNELVENLKSETWVRESRAKICRSAPSDDPHFYGAVGFNRDDEGTSHISVLDKDGMAVAITSTINLHFGAGFASESTGIILNNEMDDFCCPGPANSYGLPPNPANFIEPGKRPLSSMTPAIIVNWTTGRARLVVGAAGGIRITTSTAYAMIRNLWFGENIKEAIDSRRFHHQLFPMTLLYEEGFPVGTIDTLASWGHQISLELSKGAAVYGIAVDDGVLYANADHRKGGDVAGIDPLD